MKRTPIKFPLIYEPLSKDRKVPKKTRKPQSVNYLEGFYIDWAKELYLKGKRKLTAFGKQISRHKFRDLRIQSVLRNFLKEAAGLFPRVDYRTGFWFLLGLMLGALLLGHASAKIIPDTAVAPAPKIVHIKPVEALKPVIPKKQSPVALKPIPPPQPVYVAPVAPVGVTNCGSDPYMAYIYQHESGCRTNAIGPNGPCGLGQALPCSKLPCSLSDWSCQNAWFTAYAVRTYGSTYAAYLFWIAHSWW